MLFLESHGSLNTSPLAGANSQKISFSGKRSSLCFKVEACKHVY